MFTEPTHLIRDARGASGLKNPYIQFRQINFIDCRLRSA